MTPRCVPPLTVAQLSMPYILPHDAPPADERSAISEGSSSTKSACRPSADDVRHVPFPTQHDSGYTDQPRRDVASNHARASSFSLKSCMKSDSTHAHARRTQSTPSPPKLVHYPSQDTDLLSVRVFRPRAKPLSISNPEDETETETEGYESGSPPPFAFHDADELYTIDESQSSPVPLPSPPPHGNVHLETLQLPAVRPLILRGSVLVRNIAYSKSVVVRFSLDKWVTTSEVVAEYVTSASSIPPPFHDDGAWDRFSFHLDLTDKSLRNRTLLMAVRYQAGGGEWWDNNNGGDYILRFASCGATETSDPGVTRWPVRDFIPRTASPLSMREPEADESPTALAPRRKATQLPRASPAASRFHTSWRGWVSRSYDSFPIAPAPKITYYDHGSNGTPFAPGNSYPKTLSVL